MIIVRIVISLIGGNQIIGFRICDDEYSYNSLQNMLAQDITKNQSNLIGLFVDESTTKAKNWFIPSDRVEFISFEVVE